MRLFFFIFFIISSLFSQRLEVKADQFIAKENEKKVSFIGNAHILQGSTRIDARKIIVYFNDDNSTKSYNALGNVRFKLQKKSMLYVGRCNSMRYIPRKNIFSLNGSIKLHDKIKDRHIIGENIKINSKNGSFIIKGKKTKQAKLIFNIK